MCFKKKIIFTPRCHLQLSFQSDQILINNDHSNCNDNKQSKILAAGDLKTFILDAKRDEEKNSFEESLRFDQAELISSSTKEILRGL